jgi:hypothetical protein
LHIVALVSACGELVTGGPELEAESPAGLGVADPLAAGVGAAPPVGVGVWEGAVVGTDVVGMHEVFGDGCAPLPGTLPFGWVVPSWPPPAAGCPLPVLPGFSVPLGPATGAVPPDADEAMFTIACRTPGTASAVPANKTTAARASTGLSRAVPARCLAVRARFAVAAAARRPAAAAAAVFA